MINFPEVGKSYKVITRCMGASLTIVRDKTEYDPDSGKEVKSGRCRVVFVPFDIMKKYGEIIVEASDVELDKWFRTNIGEYPYLEIEPIVSEVEKEISAAIEKTKVSKEVK